MANATTPDVAALVARLDAHARTARLCEQWQDATAFASARGAVERLAAERDALRAALLATVGYAVPDRVARQVNAALRGEVTP